ncbi:hypothetical protein Lalb_Chr21g0311981 [Lupinus albus]|uniref:Uncharacterized protein n=1 Tax=Lupinus albus TaxID=3870 RepID=A0A6A4NQ23_LUPAL|nr:hypothetical protein Lalb_Chr21g0311981 [Lupinus albus]
MFFNKNCHCYSFAAYPTIGSKISRESIARVRVDKNDVEELEMLLEAYFMQIDGTLNKLTTVSIFCVCVHVCACPIAIFVA